MRTTPNGAVAVDANVAGYAFLRRRAIPTRLSKPEPKSHTAAGNYALTPFIPRSSLTLLISINTFSISTY
jgi:hypothetical protein